MLLSPINSLRIRGQILLDRSVPFTTVRWLVLAVALCLFLLRIYYLQGFFIVTYGLGIYVLNLFIGFLQPQDEVELARGVDSDDHYEGGGLPQRVDEEFKPFRRRVPEFKFWWNALKATGIATLMTLFSIFDLPVFWPVLLLYFFVLFALTMRRQIKHMIDFKYLPFDFGKKRRYSAADKIKKKTRPLPKVRNPLRPTQQAKMRKISRD